MSGISRIQIKEPIIRLTALLLFSFILILVVLALGNSYIKKRDAFLNSLVENEEVKVELSYILKQQIEHIHTLFPALVLSKSLGELDHIHAEIQAHLSEMEACGKVVGAGGIFTHISEVSAPDGRQAGHPLRYINYYKDRVNLEVIELSAKFEELRGYVREFYFHTAGHITSNRTEDRELDYRFLLRSKGVTPFFQRMKENSHRIYLSAQWEMGRLRVVRDLFQKRSWRLFRVGQLLAACAVCGLGTIIVLRISVILRDRDRFHGQLREVNEHLEQTVARRTQELSGEVEVRKKVEQSLREQADFLGTVINSLSHPFYVIDVETREIIMANSMSPAFDRTGSCYCFAVSHQSDRPCEEYGHPCPIAEVKKRKKAVILEHTHYAADGSETIVEVHGYPVFDDADRVVQMIQ